MTVKSDDFFRMLDDETVVSMAKSGNRKAENELLSRFRQLVTAISSRFFCDSLQKDDIMQEGYAGLISAVYSFSDKKNVSFRTYAGVCIRNSVISLLKSEAAPKNAPLNSYIPLEELDAVSEDNPEALLISDESTGRIEEFINSRLSHMERKILLCHIEGRSYRDISEKMNISEKSVDNALQRVRTKLGGFLKQEDES